MTRISGTQPSTNAPRSNGVDNTTTVKPGDNLTRVANRHGVTVQQMLDANPQITNANVIRAGQVLNLPATQAPAPTSPVNTPPAPEHSFAQASSPQSNQPQRGGVQRAVGGTAANKAPTKMTVKKREVHRNWNLGVGHKALELNTVTDVGQRDALARADLNNDGKLERTEVWNYLDTTLDASKKAGDGKATVEQTASNEEFREALSSLYTERSGRTVKAFEKTDIKGDVLYLQFNRNKGKTREEKDVTRSVSRDKDKPELTRLDITKDFNDWPDASSDNKGHKAFKQHIRDYVKNTQADGKSMTGFVLSGHSDGQFLLEELPDHTYEKKVDVRKALLELKNEDPEIAKAFEQVEYVALQACFQGEAMGEWGQIFPNATIAGTQQFSAAASSRQSGRLLDAAIRSGSATERGASMEKSMAQGEKELAKIEKRRQPLVDTPEGRFDRAKVRLDEARNAFQAVEADVDKFSSDFSEIVKKIPAGTSGDDAWNIVGEQLMKKGYSSGSLKKLYAATNRLVLAERGVAALDGQDPNDFEVTTPGGRKVESQKLEKMRDLLFNSRFVTH